MAEDPDLGKQERLAWADYCQSVSRTYATYFNDADAWTCYCDNILVCSKIRQSITLGVPVDECEPHASDKFRALLGMRRAVETDGQIKTEKGYGWYLNNNGFGLPALAYWRLLQYRWGDVRGLSSGRNGAWRHSKTQFWWLLGGVLFCLTSAVKAHSIILRRRFVAVS